MSRFIERKVRDEIKGLKGTTAKSAIGKLLLETSQTWRKLYGEIELPNVTKDILEEGTKPEEDKKIDRATWARMIIDFFAEHAPKDSPAPDFVSLGRKYNERFGDMLSYFTPSSF